MWSYWICDTETGVKQLQVWPATGPFSRVLNAAGHGSNTFVLGVPTLPIDYQQLTRPWARTLVRCWNGAVVYAGLIGSRTYDRDTRKLTIDHVDIRTFLQARYPFGTASYWADEPNHIPGQLTVTSKSLRSIAGKVVEQGLLGTTSIYDLPIVLPTLVEAGAHSRTYYNYNFQTVPDILQDLQEVDGGPDIDFEPRWNGSGNLEWLMKTGTPGAPDISGSVLEFNMSVPKPRLSGVSVTEDGFKQLTGQFGVGEGFEVDMRVGGDGIGGAATIPARDAVEMYKTESNEATLAAYGTAAVAAQEFPTKQWRMQMLATEEPGMGNLKLGSIIRMFWSGDPWIDDGSTDVRVISFSGNEGDTISLDVQKWPL